MKAIIMAGGEGSRLRPLTCACPKPMVPVLDRPVMQYALELLRRHGAGEAAVTLMYLPERVTDYFGDGAEFGVKLTYYTETTPLGTAGSVKQATAFLDETFVVLSGDGLTDCDLTAALQFHREKRAQATMVLKRVKTPLEYGVVCTDAEGRVERFVEKPGWGEVCSDAVNTGIYLLEPDVLNLIPDDKPYDFGRELFPRMVAEKRPVYGYAMDGYWCDIGDTAAYLRANLDMLEGKCKLAPPRAGVHKQPGAIVDRSAIMEAPCYIGAGARVEPGARIGPYSVLGAGSVVSTGASVKRSVLWRGARIGPRTQLRGAIIQSGATTGEAACAFEESVLGECAALGDSAVLMPGVRVWPRKAISDGERVDQNVVWGSGVERRLVSGAFPICAPAQAVRDAQAFAEALQLATVVVARDASAVAFACQRAVVAGLMAQGVEVIDLGVATLPQARLAVWDTGASGAMHVSRDHLTPLGAMGARLTRIEERKVLGAIAREDYAMPFSGVTRPPVMMGGTDLTYVARAAEWVGAPFDGERAPQVALYCQQPQMLSLAERVFHRAGIVVRAEWEEELMALAPGELGVWLSESGETAQFADEAGMLSEPERMLLMGWTALELGASPLILPRGATRALERLAENYMTPVAWTASDPALWQRALMERDRRQFALHFDGIASTLMVLGKLREKGLSLRGAVRSLPSTFQRTSVVPVELKDKGRLLRMLSEAMPGADLSDGVTVERERGWAWISPAGDRRECIVTAESSDAEFAKELCDFCAGEIEKILKRKS